MAGTPALKSVTTKQVAGRRAPMAATAKVGSREREPGHAKINVPDTHWMEDLHPFAPLLNQLVCDAQSRQSIAGSYSASGKDFC